MEGFLSFSPSFCTSNAYDEKEMRRRKTESASRIATQKLRDKEKRVSDGKTLQSGLRDFDNDSIMTSNVVDEKHYPSPLFADIPISKSNAAHSVQHTTLLFSYTDMT